MGGVRETEKKRPPPPRAERKEEKRVRELKVAQRELKVAQKVLEHRKALTKWIIALLSPKDRHLRLQQTEGDFETNECKTIPITHEQYGMEDLISTKDFYKVIDEHS
ncbi:hypothetical protein ATANTOWER_004678 [Ataeniobius toweri]|uniref:Uncharacterized protein n=1 Tax=Ataeniobius toweri TaxID=208326 RepID=A0ABU7CFL6_9TELE|nr:hypothetical protein [Ataeniobius toweri]